MKIIDPHLHLFDLAVGNYQWLKSDNAPFWPDKHVINKNFSLNDITLASPHSLAGFVHIEAGFDNEQPWREIKWLTEQLSTEPPQDTATVFKAVAFIDITATEKLFEEQLTQLLQYDCVVGCRYILDEDATEILQQPQVIKNLTTLAHHKLSFDVQMPLGDLQAVNELLKVLALLPTLQVIINHAGSPIAPKTQSANEVSTDNAATDFERSIAWRNWQQSITLLSRFNNCAIKCSGWEMADRGYSIQWFNEVVNFCIHAFSIERVMLASNFPLCFLGKKFSQNNYHAYWAMVIESTVINQCSENEKSALLYNNALRIYKLYNL